MEEKKELYRLSMSSIQLSISRLGKVTFFRAL